MNKLIFGILLFLFYSCQSNVNSEPNIQDSKTLTEIDSTLLEQAQQFIDCIIFKNDKNEFKACWQKNSSIFVISDSGDTVYTDKSEGTFSIEIIDFNEDGYFDIKREIFANTPNLCDIALYNPKINSFDKINNQQFSSPMKLPQENLFYTYYSEGCADLDYGSELLSLNGNEAITLGRMSVNGCDDNSALGVWVYKFNNETYELIDSLPHSAGFDHEKWNFLSEYWTENKNLFVKNVTQHIK